MSSQQICDNPEYLSGEQMAEEGNQQLKANPMMGQGMNQGNNMMGQGMNQGNPMMGQGMNQRNNMVGQ